MPLIAIELERYIPEPCIGCDTAFTLCLTVAGEVIRNQISIEEGGDKIATTLREDCGGTRPRVAGWATRDQECQYDPREE